jgi:hypothetical protein
MIRPNTDTADLEKRSFVEGYYRGMIVAGRLSSTRSSSTYEVPDPEAQAEVSLSIAQPLEALPLFPHHNSPQLRAKTKIVARSVGSQVGPPSPSYLAAKRREQSAKIMESVNRLASKANDRAFHIWTQEPLQQIKRLIHFLDQAEEFTEVEHEGNACEILRQLRDSFLREGWERFRSKSVRDTVVVLLKKLASEDAISAKDADHSMDALLDAGLEPVLTKPLHGGRKRNPGSKA